MTKLSILICTLPNRMDFLERLKDVLGDQIDDDSPVEFVYNSMPWLSIGRKRNDLLKEAKGEYVAFIDDDDIVSNDYFKLLFEGIEKGVDCCSLKGIITEDGQNPLLFEHSIKYKEYKTNHDVYEEGFGLDEKRIVYKPEIKYERYPNHLNCIKASIAKQFTFPEKNFGEDHDWATQIYNSGLLKTEHYIPEVLYMYEYRRKK